MFSPAFGDDIPPHPSSSLPATVCLDNGLPFANQFVGRLVDVGSSFNFSFQHIVDDFIFSGSRLAVEAKKGGIPYLSVKY